ncbi:hypothetical protein Btru_062691 [Bulinus truncatus]|nr:hypothetical protein Btru_062691 [Bulinus truncatus]
MHPQTLPPKGLIGVQCWRHANVKGKSKLVSLVIDSHIKCVVRQREGLRSSSLDTGGEERSSMTIRTSQEQATVPWPTSRSEEETESHHRGFRAVQIYSTSRQDIL